MISDELRSAICALNTIRRMATDPTIRMALATIADHLAVVELHAANSEANNVPPHWLRQCSNPAEWPDNVRALRRGMV